MLAQTKLSQANRNPVGATSRREAGGTLSVIFSVRSAELLAQTMLCIQVRDTDAGYRKERALRGIDLLARSLFRVLYAVSSFEDMTAMGCDQIWKVVRSVVGSVY